MIKVKVEEKNKEVNKVMITGHALYDDYGKDIVCASVSSIVITTVNAILRIDEKAIFVEEKPFVIEVKKSTEITKKLIENMISLLKELERDYPKNIRFL